MFGAKMYKLDSELVPGSQVFQFVKSYSISVACGSHNVFCTLLHKLSCFQLRSCFSDSRQLLRRSNNEEGFDCTMHTCFSELLLLDPVHISKLHGRALNLLEYVVVSMAKLAVGKTSHLASSTLMSEGMSGIAADW